MSYNLGIFNSLSTIFKSLNIPCHKIYSNSNSKYSSLKKRENTNGENNNENIINNSNEICYLEEPIGEDIVLADIIPDTSPTPQEMIEDEEDLKEKKDLVLAIISERTYKQLVFEYEHKCVSQENLNLIQKIKKVVKNYEQS